MRGQSTLEYILMLAAILIAIVIGSGAMKTKTSGALNEAAEVIGSAVNKLENGLGL